MASQSPQKRKNYWSKPIGKITIVVIAGIALYFFDLTFTHFVTSHNQAPVINTTNNVVSLGQKGGITAKTVNIIEFPEPQFEIQVISENIEAGENFKTEAFLTIESKTQLKNLYLEARAPSIISFDAKPQRTGMAMFGHSGDREGFSFINIPSAWGKYKLIVISKFPEKVEITYDYK